MELKQIALELSGVEFKIYYLMSSLKSQSLKELASITGYSERQLLRIISVLVEKKLVSKTNTSEYKKITLNNTPMKNESR